MKVVHALGWYFPESVGGTEIYVAGLCRRQGAAGHDVSIAAPDPCSRQPREYVHDGVPVFRYPIPPAATRDEAQGIVAARGTEHLTAFLERARPGIFHTHSIVTGLGRHEIGAAKRAGARTILTHHLPSFGYVCRRGTLLERGSVPCDGLAEPARCAACVLSGDDLVRRMARHLAVTPLALSRAAGAVPGRAGTAIGLRASIERDAASQRELDGVCDVMVALNDEGRRILVANGTPAGKIVLNRLGHGHRTVPARARSATATPVRFGFVGRLHPTKGVLELVRAAASLPRELDFDLEIRGVAASEVERRFAADLEALARDDRRIRFASALAPADVLDVLASYDVLCSPSIWFENGPTIAIEAIAAGTPVLGTRFGNLAELIDDGVTGRLVPPADERALASALAELAGNPALVNRWRAALPAARTMDDVAADYERLYARLVKAGG